MLAVLVKIPRLRDSEPPGCGYGFRLTVTDRLDKARCGNPCRDTMDFEATTKNQVLLLVETSADRRNIHEDGSPS